MSGIFLMFESVIGTVVPRKECASLTAKAVIHWSQRLGDFARRMTEGKRLADNHLTYRSNNFWN